MAFIFVFNSKKANWILKTYSWEFFFAGQCNKTRVIQFLVANTLKYMLFKYIFPSTLNIDKLPTVTGKTIPSLFLKDKHFLILNVVYLPNIN